MNAARFSHQPVMFEEVMEVFIPITSGLFVDCTLGGGGHSEGFLSTGPSRKVLGLDRDPDAIRAATDRLGVYGDRFMAIHRSFDELEDALEQACTLNPQFCQHPSALFLDLGVSSYQLDTSLRGFSYRLEGPLDMRMDPTKGESAADYLRNVTLTDLTALLRENGESRFAGRIAKAILASYPFESTIELAEVVKTAIPAAARRTGGHPATRVFQALRIKVNDELEKLKSALQTAFSLVTPGGRIAVLSYHSGEDSIVKALFREQVTGGCTCPPRYGCVCGATPKASYIVRSKSAKSAEIELNPRSRSARLRAIELLADRELKGWNANG